MKRKFLSVICTVVAMLISCMAFFTGCGNNTPEDTTPKEYTIQYTDDSGTHQITVTAGMPYALDVVPEKTGYTVTGLFDAEVGGTQYISSTGASLSPFTDGKNMVLFPQFKAKDYTVILDYQGAAVTGVRQLAVAYGSSLPELPKNLTGEHKEFAGWYTKTNCDGTQISDEYGLIPVVSVLNETNFDLSGEYVYLYAGFEIEKFTVTCCFEAGMDTEDLQVEYGTPANRIVPKTRVNGNAPLTWSKTQGGEVWNGKVEDDTVLYAVEYAPVIELDSNGGNEVNSVVARAGSIIALPTPTKDMAKFAYWEDMQGNKYDSTTMPSKSISLKAVWQAKLVFDSNGGSDVDDISVAAGNKITLPTPTRAGFIFAGWYTVNKEKYNSTTMPLIGLVLKAGWYKELIDKKVIIDSNGNDRYASATKPSVNALCYTINCEKYLNGADTALLTFDWHITIMIDGANHDAYVNFYSQKQISSSYLIEQMSFGNINGGVYKKIEFSTTFYCGKAFYCSWYSNASGVFVYTNLRDYYYTVHYPDTTNLYL